MRRPEAMTQLIETGERRSHELAMQIQALKLQNLNREILISKFDSH